MKRLALQNNQVEALRMAFRAWKVFGTFEKRASGHYAKEVRVKISSKNSYIMFLVGLWDYGTTGTFVTNMYVFNGRNQIDEETPIQLVNMDTSREMCFPIKSCVANISNLFLQIVAQETKLPISNS